MTYEIDIRRRDRTSAGYEENPWVATAMRNDDSIVAVQFGTTSTEAFGRAMELVEEDKQRDIVRVTVS